MTAPVDLDALEEMLRGATPGEWVAQGCFRNNTRVLTGTVVANRAPSPDWPAVFRAPTEHMDPRAGADAALVAATHNTLSALLAEARAHRALDAAARETVRAWDSDDTDDDYDGTSLRAAIEALRALVSEEA